LYTSFEYKRGGYFTTVEMESRARIASRWKRNQELRLRRCGNGTNCCDCGAVETELIAAIVVLWKRSEALRLWCCGNGTKSCGCGAVETELRAVFLVDLKRKREKDFFEIQR